MTNAEIIYKATRKLEQILLPAITRQVLLPSTLTDDDKQTIKEVVGLLRSIDFSNINEGEGLNEQAFLLTNNFKLTGKK